MKKLFIALLAALLLAFAACARQPQPAISTDTQQIPNPWTDYASLDEAEAAGTDIVDVTSDGEPVVYDAESTDVSDEDPDKT